MQTSYIACRQKMTRIVIIIILIYETKEEGGRVNDRSDKNT